MPRFPSTGILPEDAVPNNAATVEDLVSSVQSLSVAMGPSTSTTTEAVLDYISRTYAPPMVNGAELNTQLTATRVLPIGCPAIDRLLNGGFREGHITEICGESGTGKTQLCMMTAALTAARGEQVTYIDTSNAFTAHRLLSLIQHIPSRRVPTDVALDRVHVVKAHTAHEVLQALDYMLHLPPTPLSSSSSSLPADQSSGYASLEDLTPNPPNIVILDSLGAVISPLLGGGQHAQGHALLALTSCTLKNIAHRHQAAVLVTNHMVGGGGPGSVKRPALGESWHNQAHLRLQLSPLVTSGADTNNNNNNNNNISGSSEGWRLLSVAAAPQVGPGGAVKYKIEATGVVSEGQ